MRTYPQCCRCRHGYFHVVNNQYAHWEMYAIGGSAKPTINSEGNIFIAPDNANAKEVTKRLDVVGEEWTQWNWRSAGDLMLNGAYFVPSGAGAGVNYALASSVEAKPAVLVETMTRDAGVLGGSNSNRRDGTAGIKGQLSVSTAPVSILSAAHSQRIIYFLLCALCFVLTALDA